MESELRELLRDRAEEAPADPMITPTLVRRARSRRRRTVALAGVVTVAVVTGSIVGVRAVLNIEPPREVAAGPEWRGLWPQSTREKAVEAQEEVDRLLESGACVSTEIENCNDALAWQLDGVEVATRYTLEVLEWDRPFIEEGFDVSGADDPGPVLLHMGTCKTFATDTCGYEARVTVERLVRPARGGLWFVTDVALSASVERAEAMVRAFLEARVAGSGADMYLSPVAKGIYDDHVEGVSLYGDFTEFRVLNAIVVREGVYRFEVLLQGPGSEPDADPRYRFENLSVGAGEALDGTQRPALILSTTVPSSAKVVESITPTPTTGEPASLSEDEVMDFVAAFMDARIAGQGADVFLSPYAAQQYAAHEGSQPGPGLYLYGSPYPEGHPSADYLTHTVEVVEDWADETTACPPFFAGECLGPWRVVVSIAVHYPDSDEAGQLRETIYVGVNTKTRDPTIRAAFAGTHTP